MYIYIYIYICITTLDILTKLLVLNQNTHLFLCLTIILQYHVEYGWLFIKLIQRMKSSLKLSDKQYTGNEISI